MSEINIRRAEASDTATILQFVKDLAEYEKALHEVAATEEQVREVLFCDNPRVEALICEIEGKPAGFAVYFFSFSTWLGKLGLFLEDLYVSPEHRGSGAGKALLKHLAQIAVARDCGRFEWNVLDWNEPAIRFYENLGAKPQSEWTMYRLTGEALQRVGER